MALQELAPFRDCYNVRFGGSQRSRQAVLFLHGFPAEQGNKNIDLAETLAQTESVDTYLLHYHGLGKSEGRFSFSRSILDSIYFARHLLESENYERLHLVGHSWGGLVAINVFEQLHDKRGALVLLAPFTRPIQKEDGIMHLALHFLRHYPHILPPDSLENVHQDLEEVFENRNPLRLAPHLLASAHDALIVHASGDDTIPKQMNQDLWNAFDRRPEFLELDSDHRFFRNRDKLLKTLLEFIKPHLKT